MSEEVITTIELHVRVLDPNHRQRWNCEPRCSAEASAAMWDLVNVAKDHLRKSGFTVTGASYGARSRTVEVRND